MNYVANIFVRPWQHSTKAPHFSYY